MVPEIFQLIKDFTGTQYRRCQDYVYVKWEYYVENEELFETWK